MPHRLREDQVAQYARDGYLFPVPVLSAAEVALWRGELDPGPDNMIRRGQGISRRFDTEKGSPMPMAAGEMSLHHTDLVHASGANRGTDRRIGYAISYIPAHVRPVGALRPSALCVRGRDHGHFLPEARLQQPLSDAAFRAHREALQRFRAWQDAGFAPAAAV